MIKGLFSTIEEYKEILAIGISFFGIIVPLFQYLYTKKREQDQINFERFHEKIIRKIANRDAKTGLDEQIAVIFDLKRFPEYYPVSKRILTDLKDWWKPQLKENPHFSRLIKEADETIKYINKKCFERLWSEFKSKYL